MGTVRASSLVGEDQPPVFHFITVDGTRLRYFDSGSGTPVVLLHGNGSMIEDFLSSGVVDHAPPGHRLIAFDRPGFGYSERPHGRTWSPPEQAGLLLDALAQLGAERPIIVGHSWGSLVALAMAIASPEEVAGLVLMAGYYYPVSRRESVAVPTAFPFGGDVLRLAVRRMMAADTLRRVFAPCTVPERFKRVYPLSLALRVSQMRAVDEEAAMLPEAARALARRYGDLRMPIQLIAGSDDRIVDTDRHSARLHQELSDSAFRCIPGCGHMVHHTAPWEVATAIAEIGQARRRGYGSRRVPATSTHPGRQWLHIGEGLAAA
jgi:pimeloyl-ACP methyl ester carboxylesterase